MDFSARKSAGTRFRYYDSGTGSDIQLVFLPGAFNAEVWRHQVRYFSRKYRTIAFDLDENTYEEQKKVLDRILEQDDVSNAVLIGYGLGSSIPLDFEYHEKVIATVLTSLRRIPGIRLPRTLHRLFWQLGRLEPKLLKKVFFTGNTDYRIVKQFSNELVVPERNSFESFRQNYMLRRPVKKSLVIHAGKDFLASKTAAKRLKPNASISVINDAGSFSFYEKPQDFNKALHDFLSTQEDFAESRRISRVRKNNRSLKEFEASEKAEVAER